LRPGRRLDHWANAAAGKRQPQRRTRAARVGGESGVRTVWQPPCCLRRMTVAYTLAQGTRKNSGRIRAAALLLFVAEADGTPLYNPASRETLTKGRIHHGARVHLHATGIGSLPLTDPDAAVALALRYLPEAPFLAAAAEGGFQEHMGGQYSEGLPQSCGTKLTAVTFDTTRDLTPELERFFGRYLEKITVLRLVGGLRRRFSRAVARLQRSPAARGAISRATSPGPLTAGISTRTAGPGHHPQRATLRRRGQEARHERRLAGPEAGGFRANRSSSFLDEPALGDAGVRVLPGSAGAGCGKSSTRSSTRSTRRRDRGIHCCGNADWPWSFNTRVDIVNFDAFDYLERVLLYPRDPRILRARRSARVGDRPHRHVHRHRDCGRPDREARGRPSSASKPRACREPRSCARALSRLLRSGQPDAGARRGDSEADAGRSRSGCGDASRNSPRRGSVSRGAGRGDARLPRPGRCAVTSR